MMQKTKTKPNTDKKYRKKTLKANVVKPRLSENWNVESVQNEKEQEPKKKTKKQKTIKQDFSSFESKFNIEAAQIEKAIEGVKKFVSENPKLKNQLFSEEFPLNMQINCFKQPKTHPRIIRLPLAHSIFNKESDICLIVSEWKGIPNKEHEKHIAKYEELLSRKEVKNITKIMTFHEFRTEYETFELRSKLVDLYDAFLVDSKICGKVTHKCGKLFYQKKKVPVPIKMQATKLKEHIDNSLKKTPFHFSNKGDSFTVKFGHSKMETSDMIHNVYSVLEGLDKEFPGGFGNIRNVYLTAYRAISIPIYLSTSNPNEVPVPKIKKQAVKHYKTVHGELSTVPNAEVSVLPGGEIRVKKIKSVELHPDDVSIDKVLKKRNKLRQPKRKAEKGKTPTDAKKAKKS